MLLWFYFYAAICVSFVLLNLALCGCIDDILFAELISPWICSHVLCCLV